MGPPRPRPGGELPGAVDTAGHPFPLEPRRDFARLVRRHQGGILVYFRARVTNASVEGVDRKAEAVSQRAYGCRTVPASQAAPHHVPGELPMPETNRKIS